MTNKVFKAEIIFMQSLVLTEGVDFSIGLTKTEVILAEDKEKCVARLTDLVDCYRQNAYSESGTEATSYPYKSKILLVTEITIYELNSQPPNKRSWEAFFYWKAGGDFLAIYDAPFLRSIYKERRNEKGAFKNADTPFYKL